MAQHKLAVILDLDDTLIFTHRFYSEVIHRAMNFLCVLGLDVAEAPELLLEIERENIKEAGFAKDRFPLSLGQLYQRLCEDQGLEADPYHRHQMEGIGWAIFGVYHPPVPGALTVLSTLLDKGYSLHLFTKGDHNIQRDKIERSGLTSFFSSINIALDKNEHEFLKVCSMNRLSPDRCVMIGDSLKADIIPALNIGMNAINLVVPDQWQFEVPSFIPPETDRPLFRQIKSIKEVPSLLERSGFVN